MTRYLREERGIRALLCEGGPGLHGELQAAGPGRRALPHRSLRSSPAAPSRGSSRASCPQVSEWELAWLLEESGELFARYRRAG